MNTFDYSKLIIRFQKQEDTEEIVKLVNSAFDHDKTSNNHKDLMDSDRTDNKEINSYYDSPFSSLLLFEYEEKLIATVVVKIKTKEEDFPGYLEDNQKAFYCGCYSVHPEFKMIGIGTKIGLLGISMLGMYKALSDFPEIKSSEVINFEVSKIIPKAQIKFEEHKLLKSNIATKDIKTLYLITIIGKDLCKKLVENGFKQTEHVKNIERIDTENRMNRRKDFEFGIFEMLLE